MTNRVALLFLAGVVALALATLALVATSCATESPDSQVRGLLDEPNDAASSPTSDAFEALDIPDSGPPDARLPPVPPNWPVCGVLDCSPSLGIGCCDTERESCIRLRGQTYQCCTRYMWWRRPGFPCQPYCQRGGEPLPLGRECTP